MDDFFLPPERKTPERLAQPGGNVDYERFFAQVLSPLSRGEPVLYQPYRCHSGTLEAARTIPPAPLAVVEGVYSLRPEFQSLYQVKCFLTAPWPVREARLLDRCGPDGLERFRTLWIPLEDQYFQVFSISGSCDVHLETAWGKGGGPAGPPRDPQEDPPNEASEPPAQKNAGKNALSSFSLSRLEKTHPARSDPAMCQAHRV